MNGKNLFWALSAAGALLLGPAIQAASAQESTRWGDRQRPLEGRRYETMRALAHYLDETAQDALQTAIDDSRQGSSSRRVIPSLRDFARRADDFHRLVDDYEATRFDIPPRVNDLISRARRVNARLRTAYAEQSTREDWNNVIDVLDRMRQLMAGQDVQVPAAHGDFEDYDRDYGPFRDTHGGVARTGDMGGSVIGLRGQQLQEFRRLAHELDTSALRAHQLAETSMASHSHRHQQFLADLRRFAERAQDIHKRADNNIVDPRDIGPIVNKLLTDARSTDRSLRETRVFPEVWDQWTRTIDVLNRMADLVRD